MQTGIVAASRSRIECELHENRPLRLVDAEGRRVQCLTGVVWITACGRHKDVFLKPGDIHVIPNCGLVLVEAVAHCRIWLDLPHAFDYAQHRTSVSSISARLLKALQGLLLRNRLSTHGKRT